MCSEIGGTVLLPWLQDHAYINYHEYVVIIFPLAHKQLLYHSHRVFLQRPTSDLRHFLLRVSLHGRWGIYIYVAVSLCLISWFQQIQVIMLFLRWFLRCWVWSTRSNIVLAFYKVSKPIRFVRSYAAFRQAFSSLPISHSEYKQQQQQYVGRCVRGTLRLVFADMIIILGK